MVVWLSCYAWVPFVFLVAYDKAKSIFNKCCKKKIDNKKKDIITKEETNRINEEIKKEIEKEKEN